MYLEVKITGIFQFTLHRIKTHYILSPGIDDQRKGKFMISSWTKQFLAATGLFALILTGQTLNTLVKEKQLSQKTLENAPRSAHVTSAAYLEFN